MLTDGLFKNGADALLSFLDHLWVYNLDVVSGGGEFVLASQNPVAD